MKYSIRSLLLLTLIAALSARHLANTQELVNDLLTIRKCAAKNALMYQTLVGKGIKPQPDHICVDIAAKLDTSDPEE